MAQAGSLDRARVDVLRYRYHDSDLAADRTGVYGFQAVCPGCWMGERRQVISTARRDLAAHLEWFHRKRGEDNRDA